jgi:hypothetical protein
VTEGEQGEAMNDYGLWWVALVAVMAALSIRLANALIDWRKGGPETPEEEDDSIPL